MRLMSHHIPNLWTSKTSFVSVVSAEMGARLEVHCLSRPVLGDGIRLVALLALRRALPEPAAPFGHGGFLVIVNLNAHTSSSCLAL